MMIYLQPRKRRGPGRRARLALVAFGALVLLFASAMWDVHVPRPAANAITAAAKPLWRGETAVFGYIQEFSGLLSSKRDLVLENRQLKESIEQYRHDALLLEAFRDENRELKLLLDRSDSSSLTLARVLAGPNVSPYDTLIIDAGSSSGVATGDVVMAAGGVVVGTVANVREESSQVQLFSAPGRETSIRIGKDNVTATALGEGGGNFSARLPRGLGVQQGDHISMPLVDINIFGVVEAVIDKETEPFQTVLFKNPVNTAGIRWVQVRTGGDSPVQ